MGMKLPFLLSLGCYSKQIGDEGDLPSDVSFVHPSQLSLANHVHHLIALKRSSRRFHGKEAHPRLDQPFEKAMILLHQVIEIFDLPQFDTLSKDSGSFEIRNGFRIGSILINVDHPRS